MTVEQLREWATNLEEENVKEVMINGTIEITGSNFDKDTIGWTHIVRQ